MAAYVMLLVEVGKCQNKRDAQVSLWRVVVTATGRWWTDAWAGGYSAAARHFAT